MKKWKNKYWRGCHHFLHMYQKSQLYDVRLLRYEVRQNFVILGHFSLFYPPADPENQNFEKLKKKKPGDIIILQMWTIKEDQVIYGSWDMEGDGQNFLLFWTIFPLLSSNNFSSPLSTRKVEIKRKLPEISSFYKCVPKIMITWCNGSRDMVRVGQTDERMEKVTYRDGCPT